MNILKNFHPNKLIAEYHSNFNGTIQVKSEFGQPRVIVDKFPQSGGIVQSILKTALKQFHEPQNFLLLGLGGGAILHEVKRLWPKSQLTAVEIDENMIHIARTYFQIEQISNLNIIHQNAVTFLQTHSHNTNRKYEAILVDCYIGHQIPSILETDEFLNDLNTIIKQTGSICFNRLNARGQQAHQSQKFIQTVMRHFDYVELKKNYCNLLVIARRPKVGYYNS